MIKGICPVCNGSGAVALTDKEKTYRWNKDRTERSCTNCGGQTMYGQGTGKVFCRADGTPCVHEYNGQNIGRCLNKYTCKHCGDTHTIDSGD